MAMIYFYDILASSKVRKTADPCCLLDALPVVVVAVVVVVVVVVACSTFLLFWTADWAAVFPVAPAKVSHHKHGYLRERCNAKCKSKR